MSEDLSTRNEKESRDEQAASTAISPFEVPPNGGAKDKNSLSKEAPRPAQSQLSRTERIFVLVPVILTYFLWFLDLAVISTATPAITSEFNSLVDVGWYAWQYWPANPRYLLTVSLLQVRWGVSTWQFCIHAVDRQNLPVVLHQGELDQDIHALRSGTRLLTSNAVDLSYILHYFRGGLDAMRNSSNIGHVHRWEDHRGHWLLWYLDGRLGHHHRYPAW